MDATISDAWALLRNTGPLGGADKVIIARALAARDAELAEMRDILLAVKSETMGAPVAGGDGATCVVRPISGATYNRIVAALGKAGKP